MYTVYVLKSKNFEKTYVGMTDNVARRLTEHNEGKSSFTKNFLPWDLVYEEKFPTRAEARVREKYFKSASGRKFLKVNVFDK